MQLSGCSWTLMVVLVSSAFTHATAKLRKMATRKVLTVDEVVEKLQHSESRWRVKMMTVRMILMVTWKRWRWTGGRIEERWTAIVMKRTVVTITVTVIKIWTTVMKIWTERKKWKGMCHQYPRTAWHQDARQHWLVMHQLITFPSLWTTVCCST